MQAMNRRRFIQSISAAGAGAALGLTELTRNLHAGADLPIGIQLYTVRGLSQQDFKGTLRKVSEIGYKHFEFAGYGDLTANELKLFASELGVTACGTHEGFQNFETDSENVIAYNKTLGTPYVVVPSMPPDIRGGGVDEIEKFAAGLNKYGRLVKQAGMQLCYHNHSFEFEKVEDGRTVWDVLLGAADADLVKVEVDIAWAYNADIDPVELLNQWGGRVKLLHMKDLDKDRELAPVGEGEIDLEAVAAKAKQIGVDWYIVEQDRTREGKDILDEITISYKNMVQLLS
jgi:sugar phosphate isomerase/epimerase